MLNAKQLAFLMKRPYKRVLVELHNNIYPFAKAYYSKPTNKRMSFYINERLALEYLGLTEDSPEVQYVRKRSSKRESTSSL